MPRLMSHLTYAVPIELEKEIKPGQLIQIPFFQKQEWGIIKEINLTKPEIVKSKVIKPITRIINQFPSLTTSNLTFLEEISTLYRCSLGFLTKNNLFPLQKKNITLFSSLLSPITQINLLRKKTTPPFIYRYLNTSQKIKYLLQYIDLTSQNLLLVPETSHLSDLKNALSEKIQQTIFLVTSEIKPKELTAIWMKIWSGEPIIILGTRRALFLPWKNLKNIFLLSEGHPSHKNWDMTPRFHNREAASLLSFYHSSILHLIDHTFSVETQYNVYKNNNLDTKPLSLQIRMINLKEERRIQNYSSLSEYTIKKIIDVLSINQSVFLFLNQRGSYKHIICKDCTYNFVCDECSFLLTYHEKNHTLLCHRCQKITSLKPFCPSCHGTRLKMFGRGTETLEKEVKKIIKNKPVIRIDKDNDIKNISWEAPQVIIGTQLAWEKINWPSIALFVHINPDHTLYIPEYKILEQAWYFLRDAEFRLSQNTEFIIQTFEPNHLLFRSLLKPELFYTTELKHREKFLYPPFSLLIKVSFGGTSLSQAHFEAEKLYTFLFQLTKNNPDIKITSPSDTSPAFYKQRYWKVIIIKITALNRLRIAKKILATIPENWKIDINPQTILVHT